MVKKRLFTFSKVVYNKAAQKIFYSFLLGRKFRQIFIYCLSQFVYDQIFNLKRLKSALFVNYSQDFYFFLNVNVLLGASIKFSYFNEIS